MPLILLLLAAGLGIDEYSRLEDYSQQITSYCHLEGRQFGLSYSDQTVDGQRLVKVELSPTLEPEQVTCIYEILADWHQQVENPPPEPVPQPAD